MRTVCSLFLILWVAKETSAFQVGSNKASVVQRRGNINKGQPAVAIPIPEAVEEQVITKKNNNIKGVVEEEWVKNLDYDGFAAEVTALGREIASQVGQEDVDHLNKIVSWRNAAALVGVATMWMTPNPLTVLALSTWTFASWTMIAHHTCHGGYNRVDAGGFNSRGFALGGFRRFVDWCDWMMPEAWNVEHNRLHHYHLGEDRDPDLVQKNLEFLRDMEDMPMMFKYAFASALMPVWKWFYYSPNTYKELQYQNKFRKTEKELLPKDLNPDDAVTFRSLFFPSEPSHHASKEHLVPIKQFLYEAMLPFFASRFVALPAPLLLVPGVGPALFGHAFMNLILADLVSNIHGFVTIVTNHAGEDVYTFDDEVKPKSGSFYVRQIVGSVNYDLGTDVIDFAHGWLNYQIEHHVWPDFSMRQYQKAAPKLKAICEKYGVPYIQENVFERLRKTLDIMVGKTNMKIFPTHLEPAKDKAGSAGVTWKSTNGAIDE